MASIKSLELIIPFSLEDELKRNPELKMSDYEIIKEWCGQQRHIPELPDLLLVLCLHSNYYNLEATKSTIENFLTMRSHIPEFFSNRDPLGCKELRQAMSMVCAFELPGKAKDGSKMVFSKLINTDPTNYSFVDCSKYFFMVTELEAVRWGTVDGMICIFDTTGVSLGHAGRINPTALKKLVCYVQEALPTRLKALHFVNTPPALDVIMNMIKVFIKKDFWNLMHFHSTVKSLSEFVDIDYLPNENGGKAGSISELNDAEIKTVEKYREYFMLEEQLLRVNESLRVGKCVTAGDLFGVDGSFKKLDID